MRANLLDYPGSRAAVTRLRETSSSVACTRTHNHAAASIKTRPHDSIATGTHGACLALAVSEFGEDVLERLDDLGLLDVWALELEVQREQLGGRTILKNEGSRTPRPRR